MLSINVREELEFFEWKNAEWSDEKLIAASPFRVDRTPSFYVWLRDTPTAKAGYWGDSGAYDAEYARGGLVKLLAFLRNETEAETAEYLANKYGGDALTDEDDDHWRLPVLQLPQAKRHRKPLDESVLPAQSSAAHPYLLRRGISAETQRLFDCRFDAEANAVALPWRLPSGKLANVKYRTTWGKAFWYVKGGTYGLPWPIRDLVFGIDVVYRSRPDICAITEAEIDAMSVVEAGWAAVACGGVALGQPKVDVLIRAPVKEYVIFADNDKAGDKLRQQLAVALRGYGKRASVAKVDARWKDANEALVSGGPEAIWRAIEGRWSA